MDAVHRTVGRVRLARAACVLVSAMVLLRWIGPGGRRLAAQTVERVDYLTFAHGAVPVSVGGAAAPARRELRACAAHHRRQRAGVCADEQAGRRRFLDTVFVYSLPAPTTFDRFAVPDVLKTPSPTQTFTRLVEVFGSSTGSRLRLRTAGIRNAAGAQDAWARHRVDRRAQNAKVTWVKVRLAGGIDTTPAPTFLEFSEIIGNGVQEAARLVDHFTGAWRGAGVEIGLTQDGAIAPGCYDINGRLNGTVSGQYPSRHRREHGPTRCQARSS